MAQILLFENIKNFTEWKRVFDERTDVRGAKGSRGYTIYRKVDNPNELFILLDWENEASAKEYAGSEPSIYVLEEVETKIEGPETGGLEQIA